jgi:hypothetical protein
MCERASCVSVHHVCGNGICKPYPGLVQLKGGCYGTFIEVER